MITPTLQDRMDTCGLRLSPAELGPFAEMVAATDRIAAWVRATELSYSDEPAVCFRAPRT